MLHDFDGSNHEFSNSTGTNNVEEALNDSAKEFYEAIVENGVPIYPGCTKYTRIRFTGKLLEFKKASNCSDKSFNSLIKIIMDVLPNNHTLSESYYDMKKVIKSLRVEYEKIDVCENDFMLFYGDDKNKIVCNICSCN